MDNILQAYVQVPSIAQEIGYEMKTTWWGDFTVAELIDGEKGIKDTFNRAWKYWRDDKVYTTELALVLNWKSWYWSERHDPVPYRQYRLHTTDPDEWLRSRRPNRHLHPYRISAMHYPE